MKKLYVALSILLVVSVVCGVASAAVTVGPAPNAGDCVPDGSGFEDQPPGPGEACGVGPAPNSGDGIPDGSGF